ncbi:hypothetical protein [Haloarcula laminariae]|uniref:hypothetical protein n=1 Tax=Haloarcula laminariae TaxID=2961577 RepID=UPI0021CA4CAF|nr:hypothetical protein [Halomicroarcula laminariae]
MTGGLEPTETTDGEITVIILGPANRRERIACSSFKEAIRIVKAKSGPEITGKIENQEGEILFTSVEMVIEDWENEWGRAKRRLAVDIEEYDCPHDSVGCVADDLCVQCKMDTVQDQY